MKKILLFFVVLFALGIGAYAQYDVENLFRITNSDIVMGTENSVRLSVINYTGYLVNWSSDNEDVAIVDIYGNVTGISEGTCKITANCINDPFISDSINVTVINNNPLNCVSPTEIKLDVRNKTLGVGETFTLHATVLPEKASQIVTWKSSNKAVATVDSTGKVKGIKEGNTYIKATTSNGITISCKVTVVVMPESIKMTPRNKTLGIGETFTVSASTLPENADQTLTWKSSNKAVATVDSTGKVKGIKEGSTYIKATTINGITLSCKVTVVVMPTEIKLSKRNLDLGVGETYNLVATVLPKEAVQTVTWKSSNKAVATVDSTGKVKGVKSGTTYIKATTANDITISCKVTVTSSFNIGRRINNGYNFDYDFNDFQLKTIDYLYAVDKYENETDNSKVTWKSSDNSIVKVEADGRVFAEGFGVATITATLSNGASDSIEITVSKISKFNIGRRVGYDYETGIDEYDFNDYTIEKHSIEYLDLYAIDGNGDEILDKLLTWTSSNENVIKINNQRLEPVGFGTVTITATLMNGVKDTIKVTVPAINKINICRIILNRETWEYDYFYDDFILDNLSEYLTPLDKDGTTIPQNLLTWTSSNEKVVKVSYYNEYSSDVMVIPVGVGTATITAKLPNGVKDTINITVPKSNVEELTIGREIWKEELEDYVFNSNNFKLEVGSFSTLSAVDENEEKVNDILLKWRSSNPDVVSVGSEGSVKALDFGSAIITATLSNGVKDTIKITVPEITEIKIGRNVKKLLYRDIYTNSVDYNDFELINEAELFVVDANEDKISNSIITWTSSNEKAVKIDDYGRVVPVGLGTSIIVATLPNGIYDTIKVTVPKLGKITIARKLSKDPYRPRPNEYVYDTEDFVTNNGDYLRELVLLDENENEISKLVAKWTISDENIIIYKEDAYDGPAYCAVGYGTATIKAELSNGVSDTIKVTVEPSIKVKLNKDILNLNSGETEKLIPSIIPKEYGSGKKFTWYSSDPDVVSVDSNGNVTAKKYGSAYICVYIKGTVLDYGCAVFVDGCTDEPCVPPDPIYPIE